MLGSCQRVMVVQSFRQVKTEIWKVSSLVQKTRQRCDDTKCFRLLCLIQVHLSDRNQGVNQISSSWVNRAAPSLCFVICPPVTRDSARMCGGRVWSVGTHYLQGAVMIKMVDIILSVGVYVGSRRRSVSPPMSFFLQSLCSHANIYSVYLSSVQVTLVLKQMSVPSILAGHFCLSLIVFWFMFL